MADANQPLDLSSLPHDVADAGDGLETEDDGSIKTRAEWLAGVEQLADELQDEALSCPLCFFDGTPHENGCHDCETVLHASTMLRAYIRSRRAGVRPDAGFSPEVKPC